MLNYNLMKVFATIEESYYTGLGVVCSDKAIPANATELLPVGCLLDKDHCPRLVIDKKTGAGEWNNDDSPEAKRKFAKYFSSTQD
jgi:hypothetical protein